MTRYLPEVTWLKTAVRGSTDLAERSALLIAWIVLIAVFSGLLPSTYPTSSNFASIFGSQSFVAILALGLIVVLRNGEFDLSVAATMTVAGDVLATLNVAGHWPIAASAVVALGVGAAIGLVNGILVARLRINSFIATLGVSTILEGAALWITHEETIVGISNGLVSVVTFDRFLGVSLGFYYALALMIILEYTFRFTAYGRRLLYVGKNANVARLSGLRVARLRISSFAIAGLICALAGVVLAGTSGSADPTSGLSYLLPVYAAAYLAAATAKSGQFTPVGTVIAVYFLVSGVSGLAIAGVSVFFQQIFYGVALIVAVAAARFLSIRKRRPLQPTAVAKPTEAEI